MQERSQIRDHYGDCDLRTGVIPLVGVDKPRVDWVYACNGMKDTVDKTTCTRVPALALRLVDEELEKLDVFLFVLQNLSHQG